MKLFLPQMYEHQFTTDFEKMTTIFANEIASTPMYELSALIFKFAYEHHANVIFEKVDEEVIAHFHVWENEDEIEILQFNVTQTHKITGEVFSLQVEASMMPITLALAVMFSIWHWLLLAVIIISISVSLIYVRFLSHPIREISDMSNQMKQFNLKARCPIKRSDEIGILAENLNEMAALLDQTLSNLQNTNIKLQEKMKKDQEYEKQRKYFLIAISHELKTPLMILMTYLEGMMKGLGVYQDRALYLDKARQITMSMNDLIGQLLAITGLQSDESMSRKEKVDVGQLIEETCTRYEGLADSLDISLTIFCEKDIFTQANKGQLKTVFSNILSNAIIHSKKGGLVDIQLEIKDGKGFLTIKNYGVMIAEEDLKHIFELFYRTDQARNQYTSGSGLGLYLVKHILELHQFSYGIENSKEGVVFWVDFLLI